ncbi:MAG: hypothetical protein DMG57_30580 [Acidobacteria bacterium]|nr:MAG: hypothetical protein DMG57_30580 [Acidobacteriota bacterium]
MLLTTDHLDDTMAGLSFLKSLRDSTLRAAVTFGAAAGSWKATDGPWRERLWRQKWRGSSETRDRLLAAVRKITVPLMLLYAAMTTPSRPPKPWLRNCGNF